jgi:GMP synthase (glutamine-hydrolysing)
MIQAGPCQKESMSFQPVENSGVMVQLSGRDRTAAPARLGDEPLLPVLMVLHQETSTTGRVGNALRALGHPLDIRRPRFGDPLPETLEGHAGAVIFGGPMSANDPDEYVRHEIDWIAVPLREQRPFLGICLGAQMLARQLGARVAPHPEGRAQIGYYPIRPTPAGLEVCPNWPDHVYHWHREGFELPHGAELLAEGSDFPVEAFQTMLSAFSFIPTSLTQ